METQYDFYLFICSRYPYFLLSSLLRQISKYAHQKHVGPDDAGCHKLYNHLPISLYNIMLTSFFMNKPREVVSQCEQEPDQT